MEAKLLQLWLAEAAAADCIRVTARDMREPLVPWLLLLLSWPIEDAP
jgi:hypothetical protein